MTFVLDASVAISWCFPGDPTENTPYNRGILEQLAFNYAIVPEIWPFEIANGIFVAYSKRKRIDEPQAQKYVHLLKALPIQLAIQSFWENVALASIASSHNLAAYDAAYLNLAIRRRLPLATADRALRKAAIAAGIELVVL